MPSIQAVAGLLSSLSLSRSGRCSVPVSMPAPRPFSTPLEDGQQSAPLMVGVQLKFPRLAPIRPDRTFLRLRGQLL